MEIPFDLTCWYLNSRRVLELVGGDALYARLDSVKGLEGQLRHNAELQIQKDALTRWLRAANPPPLGKLVVEGKLSPGLIFTHYSNLTFRGLPKVSEAIRKGNPPPMAEGYSKLPNWVPDGRLEFQFHHEHLTSASSWSELSGQARMFLLGLAQDVQGATVKAVPYVIANPAPGLFAEKRGGHHWHNQLEVHVDGIDTFAKVRDMPHARTKKDLNALRAVPETEIKTAFAEIIGEPTVPKDWGGERSDMFTTRVQLGGERISTAFAFKGPAAFEPMTLAHLGKNGDQIDRLFTEPADLFVLQHCHEITPAVRGTMRAYAQQMGRLRLFCLIDGYDTVRIMKAYGKCGFTAPAGTT